MLRSVSTETLPAKIRCVITLDAHVNLRLPAELLSAVDAAAFERHATRSALIRGVIEDAIDAGELPDVGKDEISSLEQIDDETFERLRELSRR